MDKTLVQFKYVIISIYRCIKKYMELGCNNLSSYLVTRSWNSKTYMNTPRTYILALLAISVSPDMAQNSDDCTLNLKKKLKVMWSTFFCCFNPSTIDSVLLFSKIGIFLSRNCVLANFFLFRNICQQELWMNRGAQLSCLNYCRSGY